MTIRKVKMALNRVERRVDDFYDIQSKESYERAIEEIQDFHRTIGVLLWDEEKCLADTWQNKSKEEDKHVQ